MENLSTATQDAIKGEAQDVVEGMAVSTGTNLVTTALADREDAPNARALRAFNREHHKEKKTEENRAAGLARQAGVRQQREAARAGGHDAELDGDAMQSLFHEPMPAPAPAPAPAPQPAPGPTPNRHLLGSNASPGGSERGTRSKEAPDVLVHAFVAPSAFRRADPVLLLASVRLHA